MKTLYEYILTATQNYKSNTALVQNSKQITYRSLLQKIIIISDQLILEGLHKGDRIIIYLKNPLNQFIASIATIRAGGVAVPLNYGITNTELDYIIQNTKPYTIITDQRAFDNIKFSFSHYIFYWSENIFNHSDDPHFIENIELFENENAQKIIRLIQPNISDIAYIHYDKESKKLIAFNHQNIIYPAVLLNQILYINPSYKELISYPVSNILGFIRIIQNIISGATSYLLQDSEDKLTIPAHIMKHKCNSIFLDIELFDYLLSNIKAITFEALKNFILVQMNGTDITLINNLLKLDLSSLKRTKIFLSYSPVEAPFTTLVNLEEIQQEKMYLGIPLPGIKLRTIIPQNLKVKNAGKLCINGNNVMEGYFKDGNIIKENFSPDNWLITEYFAIIDEKNRLYLKGANEDVLFVSNDVFTLQQMNEAVSGIFSELQCEYYITLKEDLYEKNKKTPMIFFAPQHDLTLTPETIYEKILNLDLPWIKDLLIFKVSHIPKAGNKVLKNELFKQIGIDEEN